jgi:uncharacterized protein (TIGR00251 family)
LVTLSIKVVPGASRDRVVGRHGDAIKVTVSAPPEDGRANKAVTTLLASVLGIKTNQVQVIKGHTQRMKIVQIEGMGQEAAESLLGFSESNGS